MKTNFEGLEDIGDPGLVRFFGEKLQESTHPVLAFVGNIRERLSQEIQAHPKRDTLAAALALGGLGFTVSAAVAHRHS